MKDLVRKVYDSLSDVVCIYDALESLVWKAVHNSVYNSVHDSVRIPVSDAVESVIQNGVDDAVLLVQPKNQKILRGLL